jgi:hypothetical protein
MTLLFTEIHRHDDPKNASIVFAADRRISNAKTGSYIATHKKIFELPWLKAAIGYFGLAEVPLLGKNRPMRDWLQVFIRQNSSSSSLADFSQKLTSDLNKVVPMQWHRKSPSGFHMAGFTELGKPEFWFVRNVDDAANSTLGQYETREEFQRRDVLRLKNNETQIYRNGDIRAHLAVWEKIDESFGLLLNLNGFSKVRNSKDYKEWVRFKMETIAYFYKKYQRQPIIARPIDVIVISSK